jgi:hypothetical protein
MAHDPNDDRLGTAMLVRQLTEGYRPEADVRLYRLAPRYRGREYVIVAAAPDKPHTSIDGATSRGNYAWLDGDNVTDWRGHRVRVPADSDYDPSGGYDSFYSAPVTLDEALAEIGYRHVDQPAAVGRYDDRAA